MTTTTTQKQFKGALSAGMAALLALSLLPIPASAQGGKTSAAPQLVPLQEVMGPNIAPTKGGPLPQPEAPAQPPAPDVPSVPPSEVITDTVNYAFGTTTT